MCFEQILRVAEVIFAGALFGATVALVIATKRLDKTTNRYTDIVDEIKTLQEQVKALQLLSFIEPMLRLLMDKKKIGDGLVSPLAEKLSPILEKNGLCRDVNKENKDGIDHSRRVLWDIFADSFGEALSKKEFGQNIKKKDEESKK